MTKSKHAMAIRMGVLREQVQTLRKKLSHIQTGASLSSGA